MSDRPAIGYVVREGIEEHVRLVVAERDAERERRRTAEARAEAAERALEEMHHFLRDQVSLWVGDVEIRSAPRAGGMYWYFPRDAQPRTKYATIEDAIASAREEIAALAFIPREEMQARRIAARAAVGVSK